MAARRGPRLGAVGVLLVAGLATTRPASAEVAVALVSVGPSTVPQGAPFAYRAEVSNPGSDAEAVTLTFRLGPDGGGGTVAVREWSGTIPGGGTAAVEGSVVPSQWFAGLGPYELSVEGTGARLGVDVSAARVVVPRFEDVTAAVGLATEHPMEFMCENLAAGAAWGDVDGDGDLDLYLPQHFAPAQLWINEGGRFADRASEAGADNGGARGLATSMADYDNDGDLDVYVTNDGPNRLYRNDGSGRFRDIAPQAGVDDPGPGTGAAWGDYDRDGLLDLYVVNYVGVEEADCTGESGWFDDVLYHNEGDGTFTDSTESLHATGTTRGAGLQASWFDHDGDGDLDLYLANDNPPGTPYPNVLWRNDGRGRDGSWRFTDVSDGSGADVSINSMGTAIGDYDRDGDLDLAVSNMGPNVLLRNEGDGAFTDRAGAARVARPEQRAGVMSITWGMEFRDLNGDGWEDLYAAAGDMAPPGQAPAAQPNAVLVNAGDGTFLDLSAPSGADDPDMSRGVAVADYDADGRLDLYVVNQGGSPRLYRNVTPRAGHWLEVDTAGTVSNRDGCGARLVAEVAPSTRLVRQVLCGSTGFASGSDPTVHFGLGAAQRVRRLTIEWPSGARQSLRNVEVDRRIVVRERLAPRNERPSAADDTAATDEDTTTTIDVLANDGDADRDALFVSMVDATSVRGGSVSCTRAGTCSYLPAADDAGTDSFEYTVADGRGGVDTATATVTVRPVNDRPRAADDFVQTDEDSAVMIDVLANDADPEGDALVVSDHDRTSARGGVVSCSGAGECSYSPPANLAGADSFGYTASEPAGLTDEATVAIEISAVNDAPVAADDAASTPQYEAVTVAVAANDSDPDGDPLVVSLVSGPAHGTAQVEPDGSITYAPDATFRGTDAFRYAIADPSGASDTATVTILEAGCGEDGPASAPIDDLEPLAGGVDPRLARLAHDINCTVVVPVERLLPR